MPVVDLPNSWLGFTAALLACQVLAFAWYSPALFGRQWQQALGKAAKGGLASAAPGDQARILASNAIMIFVLANVLRWSGASEAGGAIWMALLLCLGFAASSSALRTASEGRSWVLWRISNGYGLASLGLASLLLTLL